MKQNKFTKRLAMFLAVLMLFSALPSSALALAADELSGAIEQSLEDGLLGDIANNAGTTFNTLVDEAGNLIGGLLDEAGNVITNTFGTEGDETPPEPQVGPAPAGLATQTSLEITPFAGSLSVVYLSSGGSGDGSSSSSPVGNFADACSALAATGGEIRLLSDLTMSNSYTLNTAMSITITSYDGTQKKSGAWTIERTIGDTVITVNSGTMVFDNVFIKGGVAIAGGQATLTSNGKLFGTLNDNNTVVVSGGTFTLDGGEISGSSCSGVAMTTAGTFIMNSGTITGCSGAGVWMLDGSISFVMKGGSITGNGTGNLSEGNHSGVSVLNGTFTIDTGAAINISGNKINGVTSNVNLAANKKITLTATQPAAGSSIGVTAASAPYDFTTGSKATTDAWKSYFSSDNPACFCQAENQPEIIK